MTRAAALEPSETLSKTPPGYVQQATLPLQSLIFLLPFILLYEFGTQYFTTAALHGREQQIIAFSIMQQFFCMLGATGRHMPAMALVGMLLGWHIARNDSWKVGFTTIAGMVIESIVLGLPLLMLAYVVNHYLPLTGMKASAIDPNFSGTSDRLVMDLGAGVYEEFVFRLILFALFSLVLKDFLRLKDGTVYVLMVVASGILFSLYHYWSPNEHFLLRIFAFRALAGVYFGLIFIFRGFGITAGSHFAYDIIVTLF